MATDNVQMLNPEGLHTNRAFTHIAVVSGPAKTIYIGGQNALNAAGEIVGKGDIVAQTEQVFHNLQVALAAAGATLEHIIKWNIYVVQGQPTEGPFGVFLQLWGKRPNPPLITMMFVAGLANPDFLIELEAVAIVPV